MIKYIELTMISGKTYYLINTENTNYSREEVNYMLRGNSTASIRVNTDTNISSSSVFINPVFIESFKITYE